MTTIACSDGMSVDLRALGFTSTQVQDIRNGMEAYRKGDRLPEAYVELHRAAAEYYLEDFAKEQKVRVITTEMVRDGWCDGMRVLRVIAEDLLGNLIDFRWSDANGGSWFKRLPSGGQVLVHKVGVPGRF